MPAPARCARQSSSANNAGGSNVIDFNVAGTIQLTSASLPAITDATDIDGTTAPGFAGTPVVEVNFNGFAGLQFNPQSAGSALHSLAIVDASGTGVTLSGGGQTLIVGNYIGLGLDGATVEANGGDGLELDSSNRNTIESNLISGNGGNGIGLYGSNINTISTNFIGTDVTGTLNRGNAQSGILVTTAAEGNIIGGTTTSLGNLISGNDANGVLITNQATQNTLSGNIIGLTASGNAALGNTLDGVMVQNADNNLVGQSEATYDNADSVSMQPVSGWQGIRGADTAGQYLITGTSGSNGLLFDGTMAGVGTSYAVDYPNAATTSVYGPNNLGGGNIQLVGSYKNTDAASAAVVVNGFVFTGTTADLAQSSDYQTIDYPGAEFNYVHSTMGGLAVGNYDSQPDHGEDNLPLGPGHAYIYDIATQTFLTDVDYPGSASNTAYGIWYNGGTSYTICGGWSPNAVNNLNDQSQPIGQAYMVDYDSATGKFSNWTSVLRPERRQLRHAFRRDQQRTNGRLYAERRLSPERNERSRSGIVGHRQSQCRRLIRRRDLGQSQLYRLR